MDRPFTNYCFVPFSEEGSGFDWHYMSHFLKLRGAQHIDEYLEVEKNFVDTAMMFINYFEGQNKSLLGDAGTSVTPRVRAREHFDKEWKKEFSIFYPSFEVHMDKMEDLCNKHHSLLTQEDLVYLLESAYRCFSGFSCSFMYNFASLNIRGDEYFSMVTLHHSYRLHDIFSNREHVHFSVAHHGTDTRIEDAYGENILACSRSNIQL